MSAVGRAVGGMIRTIVERTIGPVLVRVPYSREIVRARHLTIYPDDVFLVSYPRSGNTWARFLIGNLLNPADPVTFANVESRIPDVYRHHNEALALLPRTRFLKSHEYFTPRYPKVMYLVRDPRDVAISFYHYLRKTRSVSDGVTLRDYVPHFIAGEFHPYGTWGEHVGGWLGARQGDPAFLLIRCDIAAFLALPASDADIAQAVARSSFKAMQQMERAQSEQWVSTRGTRPDIPFVREARSGGWRETLDPDAVQQIAIAWSRHLAMLGYEDD
jgi:hypothetical protein